MLCISPTVNFNPLDAIFRENELGSMPICSESSFCVMPRSLSLPRSMFMFVDTFFTPFILAFMRVTGNRIPQQMAIVKSKLAFLQICF